MRTTQGAGKGRSPCRRRSRGFRAKRGSSFLGGGAGGGTPPPQRFFSGLRGRGDAATLLKLRASSFWQGGVAALRRYLLGRSFSILLSFPLVPFFVCDFPAFPNQRAAWSRNCFSSRATSAACTCFKCLDKLLDRILSPQYLQSLWARDIARSPTFCYGSVTKYRKK